MNVVLGHGPQIVSGAGRIGPIEPVGNDNAFNHVGQHGHPRAVLDGNRHDKGSIGASPKRAAKPDHPRRASKARDQQPEATRLIPKGSDGFSKLDGRCFHDVHHYGSAL